MAAEQWYLEEDEDSISGHLIGYRVKTLTSQDYFDFGPEEDEYSFKTDEEAYDAACARVKELDRMADVAAAAPLIARAMRAIMVKDLYRSHFCSASEFLESLKELGWDGKPDCPAEAWIDNITNQALKECQRLEIK